MPSLVPYSADDVIMDFGGFQLHGLLKGTFCKVHFNSPRATLKMGADGEPTLIRSVDDSATVEVTLQQDSASNDWLSANAAAFRASGAGILPFALKDLTGRTLCTAQRMWVQTEPDVEYSDEDSSRVWVLETDSMQRLVAGRG